MSITFACGNCGKSFTIEDKFAGKKGRCKQCGAVMPIPERAATRAVSSPAELDLSPSQRPPTSARISRENVYGFGEPPIPARSILPPGIEEVEEKSPVARRLKPRSGGLYDPPRKKTKRPGGGSVVDLVIKIAVAVVLGLVGLSGLGTVLMNMAGVSSRNSLESILQERVDLNRQLASVLTRVNDVPTAQATSSKAVGKIRAIAANLRKLKTAKGLKTDLDALKRQYQIPQEQASQQVVQQFVRIAAIAGAWDALDVQPALEDLDREEKSIAGTDQVQISAAANPSPVLSPPVGNPGPPPGANPGMRSGPNSNRTKDNRPKQGNRKGINRPNVGGPG